MCNMLKVFNKVHFHFHILVLSITCCSQHLSHAAPAILILIGRDIFSATYFYLILQELYINVWLIVREEYDGNLKKRLLLNSGAIELLFSFWLNISFLTLSSNILIMMMFIFLIKIHFSKQKCVCWLKRT